MSLTISTCQPWTGQTCSCAEGGCSRFCHNEMEERHYGAIVDSIYFPRYLESQLEAKDAEWVGTVEHLRFKMYLEFPWLNRGSTFQIVIVILGPIIQAIIDRPWLSSCKRFPFQWRLTTLWINGDYCDASCQVTGGCNCSSGWRICRTSCPAWNDGTTCIQYQFLASTASVGAPTRTMTRTRCFVRCRVGR